MLVEKFKMIPLKLKFIELHLSLVRHISASSQLKSKPFRLIDEVIPKNVMKEFDNGALQKQNGKVYDHKPFKLKLEKGKRYRWCLCGYSKSQPLCDGTHAIEPLEIKLKPIQFEVSETKEYWLCNCKHTTHRPFCDGSHIEIVKKANRKLKLKLLKRAAKGDDTGELGEDEELTELTELTEPTEPTEPTEADETDKKL